jgi:RimJ/RimL family protein N-acetyltransferase
MKDTEYSLVRLFETSAEFLIDHFNRLDEHDIRLRFGFLAGKNAITSYVKKTIKPTGERTEENLWFAIKKDKEIVATLHVALYDERAEFGFTVLKDHRGKKLGQLLFARGYQVVTERSIDKIHMTCLSENKAIQHIAKKFGMEMHSMRGESESVIEIQYPVPLTQVDDIRRVMYTNQ